MKTARVHLIAGALFVGVLGIAQGQFTETWDGGDGADQTNWNFNWADDSAPATMQGNIHWAGNTRLTPNNNFGVAGPGYRMYFDAGAGAFTLGGDSVTFYSFGGNKPVIWNQSSNTQTINLDILHGNSDSDGAGVDTYGLDINAVNADLVIGNITGAANGGDTGTRKLYFRSDDDIGTSPGNDSSMTTPGGDGQYTTTVNGVISNGAVSDMRVHKEDWGILILNGDNSYTGNTDLDVGTIQITESGDISESNAINLGGGGEERTSAPDRYAQLYLTDTDGGSTISNTLNMGVGDAGVGNQSTPSTNRTLGTTNTSGTNTYSGTINITGGLNIDSATGGIFEFTGAINSVHDETNGKASFHGGTSPTFTYGVDADGVRIADKDGGGAGTVIFNTTSKDYTGITDIDAGTLQINTTVNGTSSVDIAAGATLSGDSSIGSAASTATNNGNIAPGATSAAGTIGTLTFGGDLVTEAGSTWLIDINNNTTDFITITDQFNVNGGSITFNASGAQTDNVILIASYAGSVDDVDLTGTNIPTNYKLVTYWDNNAGQEVAGGAGSTATHVALVLVPEPGSLAVLSAVLGLALAVRRRQQFQE